MKTTAWVSLVIFLLIAGLLSALAWRVISLHRHVVPNPHRIRLKDITPHTAQSGDLILFKWNCPLSRSIMEYPYIHIGVLYFHPTTHVAYVWESNFARGTVTQPDLLTGMYEKSGCKLVELKTKVQGYVGLCYLHRFQTSFATILGGRQAVEDRFQLIFRVCRTITFHKGHSWMQSLMALSMLNMSTPKVADDGLYHSLRNLRRRSTQPRHMLCCELAVYTWWMLGVWQCRSPGSTGHAPHLFLPHDFAVEQVGRMKSGGLFEIDPS